MSDRTIGSDPVRGPDGGLASKTVIGVAWLLGWRVVTRSLGIVSTLVLARILTPGDFGLVAMATAFSGAVDALSQLGLEEALVRRVGDDRRLFNTAFTLQLGRAIATSAIVAAAAPFVGSWFGEARLTPLLLVLAAGSFLSGFENIGCVEFRRSMRFDVQFKLLSVPRLLQVATTISAALLLQSYWALLFGIIVSKFARTAMTYIVHPYRPGLRLDGWRELAGFSFWTWAISAAEMAWEKMETFVLGPAIGPAKLGLYLTALDLAALPNSEIVAPATDVMFAAFASAQKHGSSSVHHAPLVAATLVMCVMPITITISCASGYVVAAMLGPKWIAAQPLIAILAWLCLFSPMSYVCNVVLIANNYVRRAFFVRISAAGLKLLVVLIAVSTTDRLDVLAAIVTAVVMIESSAYMTALKGTGRVELRSMIGPLSRTLVAGALVTLCAYGSGFAWQTITMPSAQAFLSCAVFASLVATFYTGMILALWRLAGRPSGPETRLLELAKSFARSLAVRARLLGGY